MERKKKGQFSIPQFCDATLPSRIMQPVMIRAGIHGLIYLPPTAVRVPANNGHANSDFGTPNKGDCKRK